MSESYPPKGYDPLVAPKVNPSPSQSLWQAELIASATARRNMESVRAMFGRTYAPYMQKLRGRFGADITSGVLRETGLRTTDSVGSPRFRKSSNVACAKVRYSIRSLSRYSRSITYLTYRRKKSKAIRSTPSSP